MTSRLSRPRCAIVNCRCSTCCMAEPALPQAFSLCAYYIPACCHRPVRQPHYLTAFALLPHTRVVKSTARCPGSHHEPSRGSATRSLYAPLRRHLPTSTTTPVHAVARGAPLSIALRHSRRPLCARRHTTHRPPAARPSRATYKAVRRRRVYYTPPIVYNYGCIPRARTNAAQRLARVKIAPLRQLTF